MFVITCNSLSGLNDFLINRPGRFHYHFRFGYPTAEDIREYLFDKVDKKFHSEINKVVAFSRKIDLNYDCLRAIAFELNTGTLFKDAILDLNIIKDYNNRGNTYSCKLYLDNGMVCETKTGIDMFSDEKTDIWFHDKGYTTEAFQILFNPKELDYDPVNYTFSINSFAEEDFNIDKDEYYNEELKKRLAELDNVKPVKLELIKMQYNSGIHYSV